VRSEIRRFPPLGTYIAAMLLPSGPAVYAFEMPDCTPRQLLEVEQQWISTLWTTDPEHGYNIDPTTIASDYATQRQRERA
jgi:hypothetical protein